MAPTLDTPVARGGMSTVHRVADGGRDLAVKVIDGDVEMARFTREARVLAQLDDPAIVKYVGHGVTPDGKLFLAMEWLEGETLAARLARGPLGVEETVALARRVAGALAVAHAAGVVHRDIKPTNLYLVGGSVRDAKLIDFGIARMLGAATQITSTGTAIGTPAYMAPEQIRGSRQVDARADLFALGCVLYECLAGAPAFSGIDECEIQMKILFEEPATLPEAPPPALARLLAQLLQKEPGRRPADAAQAVAMLDGLPLAPTAVGSAAWYEERTELVAALATRLDHDGLLAVLSEAGAKPRDEAGRRAQLRCLSDGVQALFDLELGDLGGALAERVARAPQTDEETQAFAAAARAAWAGWRRELPLAIDDGARAAASFAAAGDTARALTARARVALHAAEHGDPDRARREADAVLAAADAPPAATARARLALGKAALARKSLADARMQLRRVAATDAWAHGRALMLLAVAALRAGHAAVAENEARAAAVALASLGGAQTAGWAVLGQALAHQGRAAEALSAARAALAVTAAPDVAALVAAGTTAVLSAQKTWSS